MPNGWRSPYGDFICVPQKWVTYVTEARVRVCVKTKRSYFPIFGVYVGPDVQLTQIKHNSTVMDNCDENLRQSI